MGTGQVQRKKFRSRTEEVEGALPSAVACPTRPPTAPSAVTKTLAASHRTCYLVTRL